MYTKILAVLICAVACSAQKLEVGAAVGAGVYKNAGIDAPAGKASAGFRNGLAADAVFADEMYEHITGELRYTYQNGGPFIAAGNTKTEFQGRSHAMHYDLLFHVRPSRQRIRPYVASGIGAKLYVGSAAGNPPQPLSRIGVLRTNNELKPLVNVGGGVKLRIRQSMLLRFDFRDYITPFPKKVISPGPSGIAHGLLHQFTPLLGVSYVF